MSRDSQVVVRRSGFFSALAHGFFGALIAIVLCVTCVAVYGVHVVDRKTDALLGVGHGIIKSIPELEEALPPVIADALDDRRAPEYREQLAMNVRLLPGSDGGHSELVVETANNGDEVITLMAVRIVLLDENGVPVRSVNTYAATPATIDQDWRGPIMPGSKRYCGITMFRCPANLTPEVEITDLRVWKGSKAPALASMAK